MKKDFNRIVQLTEPILVSLVKSINLKAFYKDESDKINQPGPSPSLWNCDALEELISLIPNDYIADDVSCELYMPVNKIHSITINDFLPHIFEEIIDLNTIAGRTEASRRLTILAHLISLQPNGEAIEDGLHPGGCGTCIGYFLFPSGEKCRVETSYRREFGAWRLNCFEGDDHFMDLGFWFAFSPKLKKLVNSSSKMCC